MGAKLCTPAAAGLRGVVVAIVIALSLCALPANAATITIDNFALPNPANPSGFMIVPPGTNPTALLSQVVSGPIGGQRDIFLQAFGTALAAPAVALSGFDTDHMLAAFQFGHDSQSTTPKATLQYSGTNNANTLAGLVNAHGLNGGLGANLIDGTNDRIRIFFDSSDALPVTAGLDVLVTITSPGGLTSTLSKDAPNSQVAFFVDFPFNQFSGTASFAAVDSVVVAFNGARLTPNIDFEVTSIIAVPEPAGLLTGALGGAFSLAALLANRRPRSRKPA